MRKQAEAHYTLSISHMKKGDYQLAFVELQKAIKFNPEDKRAYYALGLIYQYFEEKEKAEEYLKKAIQLDSKYSEAYNSLGVLYTDMKQWDKAIETYNKALKNPLYQTPELSYSNLGKVYYRMKNFNNAITVYRRALKRAPDFYTPYYGLSLCYNALGRYGEASEALSEAIKRDPIIKGDIEKAMSEFIKLKLKVTTKEEEQEYIELIEILHY